MTIREHLAIAPAPTPEQLMATVASRGVEAALTLLDQARAVDPQAGIFREPALNRLAYRVMRSRTAAEAIPLFRNIVLWFPGSSNAYDSLAEIAGSGGTAAGSRRVTARALE